MAWWRSTRFAGRRSRAVQVSQSVLKVGALGLGLFVLLALVLGYVVEAAVMGDMRPEVIGKGVSGLRALP